MSEETQDKKKKINWSADRIMSTSALTLTIISLIALLYQLSLAREENELIRKQQSASVLPHLSQWFSNTSEGFKIVFGNKGVGPAFVKDIELALNDSITFNNSDNLFRHIFKSAENLDSISYSNSTFYEGYVLPAGEEIEIIIIKSKYGIQYFKDYLATNKTEFNIEYEDVYGSRWQITNTKNRVGIPVQIPSKD
jgi:hypothetical protein